MFIFRPVAYLAWNLWTVNGGRNQRVPLVHWSQDALNVYLTGKAALDGIGPLETLSEGQRLAVEGAPQYGASEKE